jgi:DNA-binding transcriptional LysR family regulator
VLLCCEIENVKLNIEDIETFVVVADARGVSPAARRLGISKSIVSRRLLRLEAALGVQLLARTTRGAALTESGVAFREHAAKVSAEIEMARDTIMPTGDLRGRLRIAMPLSLGPTHFAPVLAKMAQRYPRLHLHASYSDRVVDLITEGFDCAVRVGYLQNSNLLAKRIGPIHLKLVASPSYVEAHGAPETPKELLAHQALIQGTGTESWKFMDCDRVITVQPQGRFKSDNGVALTAAATAGLGLAYLPDSLICEYLRSGALITVMKNYPPPPAAAYVVRPPGQHPVRKIQLLTEMLIKHFEQNPCLGGESGSVSESTE